MLEGVSRDLFFGKYNICPMSMSRFAERSNKVKKKKKLYCELGPPVRIADALGNRYS